MQYCYESYCSYYGQSANQEIPLKFVCVMRGISFKCAVFVRNTTKELTSK
jgi:CRISPR/Cas system CMR subunit Cmr6 (Cas7 group RAMP superfamily)